MIRLEKQLYRNIISVESTVCLISKYGLVCQNESCYVCQRQPRSWCVNRLLPVNHYVHIPPFIDTLFLTAHLVH